MTVRMMLERINFSGKVSILFQDYVMIYGDPVKVCRLYGNWEIGHSYIKDRVLVLVVY